MKMLKSKNGRSVLMGFKNLVFMITFGEHIESRVNGKLFWGITVSLVRQDKETFGGKVLFNRRLLILQPWITK